jgi:hypothetical protein
MPRLLLPALALTLSLVVPAAAQAPVYELRFSPPAPGKPATGTLTARDLPAEPEGGPAADTLVLALQPGFAVDAKGAPGRCAKSDADATACPEPSAIGKGTAVIEASGPLLTAAQQYTATLGVFVTQVRRPGDAAGLSLEIREPSTGTTTHVLGRVVKTGRLGGPEVRFEGLSSATGAAALPPGITVRIKSFEMSVGRKRTVRKRLPNRHHRRRYRKVTYAIVRTPATCSGAWDAVLAVVRTDGSETAQALSAACSG